MAEVDNSIRKSSEHSLWVLRILYALVLADGFFLYRDIILKPYATENILPICGMLLVYVTTLLSWIDFSETMDLSPYVFRFRRFEKIRFLVDVLIVLGYAYLLFCIDILISDNASNLFRFLIGFPIIFLLYYISGLLRIKVYGHIASRRLLIFTFFALFVILCFVYSILYSIFTKFGLSVVLNFITIFAFVITYLLYRQARRYVQQRRKRIKENGLIIGVDVDGTLADQLTNLLPVINKEYNVNLEYADINHWRFKIGKTNIAKIIEESQIDKSYILDMPMHKHARKIIEDLHRNNLIFIITARKNAPDRRTKIWLSKNRIIYDKYFNSRSEPKSTHNVDVLIDDYTGNIKEFLSSTNRYAILFKQPWNKQYKKSIPLKLRNRLLIAESWNEVKYHLQKIKSTKQQENI